MNNTPVIVPVKSISLRCPGKNYLLLKHTLNYLSAEGENNVWIISDAEDLLDIAREYNFNTFLEIRNQNQDELTSCWSFLQNNDFENFILCPVTHPFRSKGIINEMENLMHLNYDALDFIATSNIIPDREQYFIEQNGEIEYKFKKGAHNRKGALSKPSEIMIDGSMYFIKRSFLKKVVTAEDTNAAFWRGHFSCVNNKAPFLDIDTPDDLEKFHFIDNQTFYFSNK